MEVCIVGGGYSGIISAKLCLDNGFIPFILEKTNNFGGIWTEDINKISVWNSLHTNTEKYLSGFSDLIWDEDIPIFVHHRNVKEYLKKYIDKHNLETYFSYSCEVIKIKNFEDSYLVKWICDGNIREKVFKSVMICSGIFSKKWLPLKNIELFQGEVIHSSDYKEPSIFMNKKVVVVGNSISSTDICSEALEHCTSLTQVFRSKYAIVHLVNQGIPGSFLSNSLRHIYSHGELFLPNDQIIENMKALLERFGNPGRYSSALQINDISEFKGFAISSEKYTNALSNGRIQLIKGEAVEFCSNGIALQNGEIIEADFIVLATGFHRQLNYLSKNIKKIIKYNEENTLTGTTLFRSILHPDLPNFAIIGNIRNPTPCRFELQAMIAIKWFLGSLDISYDALKLEVDKEEEFSKRNMFTQISYLSAPYLEDLLKILNIHLDIPSIERDFKFKNPFFIPQFINLDNPDIFEDARKVIKEIQSKYQGFAFEE